MNYIIAIELKENEFGKELTCQEEKINDLIKGVRSSVNTYDWPLFFSPVSIEKDKRNKYLFNTIEKADEDILPELNEKIKNRDQAINMILGGNMYREVGLYLSSNKKQFSFHRPLQSSNLFFERDFLQNEDAAFKYQDIHILLFDEANNCFKMFSK